ncbi:hypothetical protein NQ318_011505 [Aromia moschata]|uniref:ABC transmembrane type-1 domain-containing protein n=1 Tax=Aromia moschata TaxID=1265417 RepID=A0AAV8XSJ0_9CUCU|nr:hypothetical protein NQ318_011505 [Aromia moschata]
MAPNYSKILSKNHALAGASVLAAVWYLTYLKKCKKRIKIRQKENQSCRRRSKILNIGKVRDKGKSSCGQIVSGAVGAIVQNCRSGWASKECGLFLLIAASLISRSMCDLWLIDSGTKIESAIISKNKQLFKKRLLVFFLAMPVVSVVNNVLKYSIGALKINLRTNMTKRLYDEYLKNYTYYRMSNLDNRISNADQLLTTDVDKFCEGGG